VARKKSKSNAVSVGVGTRNFGPLPVVSADERAGYEHLFAQTVAHVRPSDPIEEMYTRDIVDLTYELLSYRNCKARALKGAFPRALEDKLAPFMNDRHRFGSLAGYGPDGAREPTPVMELVNEWMRGNPQALTRVNELLEVAKLTIEDIRAHTVFLELGTVERFDRLIGTIEMRRNDAIREVERYRSLLAQALRAATREAEETEFAVVTARRSGSVQS
jgi:hypothetical protein